MRIKYLLILPALSLFILSLSLSSAQAGLMKYTYQGALFDSFRDDDPPVGTTFASGDAVSGMFVVNELGKDFNDEIFVDTFSFTAGDVTISSSDPGFSDSSYFEILTDDSGLISNWKIELNTYDERWQNLIVGGLHSFISTYSDGEDEGRRRHCGKLNRAGTACNGNFFYDYGSIAGSSLTSWTVTAVPEPSIIALFAAGLFGIGFARRRKA